MFLPSPIPLGIDRQNNPAIRRPEPLPHRTPCLPTVPNSPPPLQPYLTWAIYLPIPSIKSHWVHTPPTPDPPIHQSTNPLQFLCCACPLGLHLQQVASFQNRNRLDCLVYLLPPSQPVEHHITQGDGGPNTLTGNVMEIDGSPHAQPAVSPQAESTSPKKRRKVNHGR